jgi:hypothetical protein
MTLTQLAAHHERLARQNYIIGYATNARFHIKAALAIIAAGGGRKVRAEARRLMAYLDLWDFSDKVGDYQSHAQ